jgi:hypothetical protein
MAAYKARKQKYVSFGFITIQLGLGELGTSENEQFPSK